MKTKQLNIKWESADGSNHQSIELVNARPTADGEIVVAGVPETIAYLSPGDRFLGCDRRANRTYYFVERDHQPMLLGYANVRDLRYIERDNDAINEHLAYERKPNGSFGAKEGHHDDILMTRCIALSIDIDLPKNKIFNFEQVKQDLDKNKAVIR
ncbi:MAG: hypothetical protein PT955_01790, partial [Bacteroidales bacterium]|nr:hypothetical protein [Bacteroidales bacterium]